MQSDTEVDTGGAGEAGEERSSNVASSDENRVTDASYRTSGKEKPVSDILTIRDVSSNEVNERSPWER